VAPVVGDVGTDPKADLPAERPLRVSFVVRPEEIEFAFAINGETLRQRLLLALVAELTITETITETKTAK
jgi:hypothetical protein